MVKEYLQKNARYNTSEGFLIVECFDTCSRSVVCIEYLTDENGKTYETRSILLTVYELERLAKETDGKNHKFILG